MHIQRSSGVGSSDLAVAEMAFRQHGIVSRRQLLSIGMSADQIGRRVRRGYIHPIHRGIYAVGHPKVSRLGRWLAAVMACGPDAVLSHRSAGELWGLIDRSAHPTDVTRPRGWRPVEGIAIRRAAMAPDEICLMAGIRVTGLSRTLLDLASVLSSPRLEKALNEAEVRSLTDRVSIPDLLERYPRRPGSPSLRGLLGGGEANARGTTRSELEDRFKAMLEQNDLPMPRFNAHVAIAGRFFEVDCLWQSQRLIVELDGRAVHGTRRAFERDRERDRLLMVHGWRVVRVTWRQLQDDASGVLADLRVLLREGSAPPTL